MHNQNSYWCRIQTIVSLLPLMLGSRRWQNYSAGAFLCRREDENVQEDLYAVCLLFTIAQNPPPSKLYVLTRSQGFAVPTYGLVKGRNSTRKAILSWHHLCWAIKGVNLFAAQFITEQTRAIPVLAIGTPAATLPS